jgi:mycofactocin system glycosyltransferase
MSYPFGMRVELDTGVKQLAADLLFGGSPARVLRLSAAGVRALAELRAGPVHTAAGAALARRLTDTGLAHPRPEPAALDATVVIPVRDRAAELDRCLAGAGPEYRVVVVDDGSIDPAAVARVCARYDAVLVRRDVNGGPGPARNTALGVIRSEYVAFLDSDCVPPPGWIRELSGHFADPWVAAVAPRVVEAGSGRSPLDLGDHPARVAPLTRVAYVPTAALVVRRGALGNGFDHTLRYGEDVDLVWRLVEADWRVRYDPSVQVAHARPATFAARLRRRFHYGTTAAPLARRHPGALAPLVLQPGLAVTLWALAVRRPLVAAAAFTVSTRLLANQLRAREIPTDGLVAAMAVGAWQTWLGAGRWCRQFAAPALLAAAARGSWWRRALVTALLASPNLAQEAAYGTGVCAGCVRERRFTAVLPTVRASWLAIDRYRDTPKSE